MKNLPAPYLSADSARALLALSQARTSAQRKARDIRRQLLCLGWDAAAANEMANAQAHALAADAEAAFVRGSA